MQNDIPLYIWTRFPLYITLVYGHIICHHFLGIVILWKERQWPWITKFHWNRLCLPLRRFTGAKMICYNTAQMLWIRHGEYQGRKILDYMKRENKLCQRVQYPLLPNSGYDVTADSQSSCYFFLVMITQVLKLWAKINSLFHKFLLPEHFFYQSSRKTNNFTV